MATLEQVPGTLDISVVQGDDLTFQLSAAENYSGYTFITTVHTLNGGETTAETALSTGTSLSTVQVTLPATMTSALEVTKNSTPHQWKIVYENESSLIRTWVKGGLTVLSPI